jgi:hypothetical protein
MTDCAEVARLINALITALGITSLIGVSFICGYYLGRKDK